MHDHTKGKLLKKSTDITHILCEQLHYECYDIK